jgi:hypothetical protein
MTTLTFDTDTMCIRLSNGSLDAATRCEGFRGFYFLDSTMFHRGYLLKIWSAIASAQPLKQLKLFYSCIWSPLWSEYET